MKNIFRYTGIAALFISCCFTNSKAQNSFTNPVLYSLSGTSVSYTNNEGGTTTFGATFNQKLSSVTNNTTVY